MENLNVIVCAQVLKTAKGCLQHNDHHWKGSCRSWCFFFGTGHSRREAHTRVHRRTSKSSWLISLMPHRISYRSLLCLSHHCNYLFTHLSLLLDLHLAGLFFIHFVGAEKGCNRLWPQVVSGKPPSDGFSAISGFLYPFFTPLSLVLNYSFCDHLIFLHSLVYKPTESGTPSTLSTILPYTSAW